MVAVVRFASSAEASRLRRRASSAVRLASSPCEPTKVRISRFREHPDRRDVNTWIAGM
jgi:hypothetical protein